MTKNNQNAQAEQDLPADDVMPLSTRLLNDINTAASGDILQTQKLKESWTTLHEATLSQQNPEAFADLKDELQAENGGQTWIDNLFNTWIDHRSEVTKIEFARLAAIRLLASIAGSDPTYAPTVFDLLWSVCVDSENQYTADARAWALLFLRNCNLLIDAECWQKTFGAPPNADDENVYAYWLRSVPEAKVRAEAIKALGHMAKNSGRVLCWETQNHDTCQQELNQCRLASDPDDLFEIAENMLLMHWDHEIDYSVILELVKALGHVAGWSKLPNSVEAGWRLCDVLDAAAQSADLNIRRRVPKAIGRIATNIMHRQDIIPNQQIIALTILVNLVKKQIATLQQDIAADRNGLVYEQQRRYLLTMRRMAQIALDDLPKPQDGESVTIAVDGMMATADTLLPSSTVKLRSLALLLLDELAKGDGRACQLIAESGLDSLKLMLSDPQPEIAKAAANNIVTLIGEKEAAKFLVEVILGDILLEEAVNKRQANGGFVEGDNSERLQRELRDRAAEALGSINQNGAAHDELVKTLRSDALHSGRARDALIIMGGERAVESIVNYNLQQQVNDKFFDPMEEARKKGWELLEDVRNWANSNYTYALYAALVTVCIGIITFSIGIAFLLQEGADLKSIAFLITGPLMTFAGAIGAYIWEPAKGLNKVASELSRLIMSFENYLGRMRLIGLGFAHAYTQNSFDQLQFLTRISEMTAEAMRESAVSLEDIGDWPDFTGGEQFTAVPVLLNQPLKNARRLAEQAKLEIEVGQPQYDQHTNPGSIINQEPAAGVYVAKYAKIKVIPSTNQLPNVEVPDFTGKTVLEAVELAQQTSLLLTELVFEFHPDAVEGCVIKQDLRPGLNVSQGTRIMLTLAKKADMLQS